MNRNIEPLLEAAKATPPVSVIGLTFLGVSLSEWAVIGSVLLIGLQIFFLLPFEHSEDLADQHLSVELFAPYGEEYLKYAVVHRDIIERFGRFPHRNAALGRDTTPEERAFLEGGGFAG